MTLNTHLHIDPRFSGEVTALDAGYAQVVLQTQSYMAADGQGLVHGGFCFCAADYAAMASVNDPFVVLAKSETKFLAPVRADETVVFEAKVIENDGRKQRVEVTGSVGDKAIFSGVFFTVVLKQHVLA